MFIYDFYLQACVYWFWRCWVHLILPASFPAVGNVFTFRWRPADISHSAPYQLELCFETPPNLTISTLPTRPLDTSNQEDSEGSAPNCRDRITCLTLTAFQPTSASQSLMLGRGGIVKVDNAYEGFDKEGRLALQGSTRSRPVNGSGTDLGTNMQPYTV